MSDYKLDEVKPQDVKVFQIFALEENVRLVQSAMVTLLGEMEGYLQMHDDKTVERFEEIERRLKHLHAAIYKETGILGQDLFFS